MSKWPGKYVIGLTGNIATGKSVVRRMLEHLGAYGIDADALSHRATAKGAPGYQPVVDTFGKWILDPNGEIDRAKLGKLVFNDSRALKQLESIVHPQVRQAVDLIIQRASQKVIVIEAIKLLEGDLKKACDEIWVTTAPEEIQKARLMTKRGLNADDALERIQAQSSQDSKASQAKVVIRNTGSFQDTWDQVTAAWKIIAPAVEPPPPVKKTEETGEFLVERGRPRDSSKIAELITRLSGGKQKPNEDDIMAAFGDKAFMLVRRGNQLMGVAGWQVENLVTRTTEIYIDPSVSKGDAIKILVSEVEKASRDLQSEASLLFLPRELSGQEKLFKDLGYEQRAARDLGVSAWQEAAVESMPANTTLLFKQLRVDRILRPI